MFKHEKLQVYNKGLAFVAQLSAASLVWNRKHAVVEQFDRASESLIINLADAAGMPSTPKKLTALDYAVGSGLECAACLDIARIKEFLSAQNAQYAKERLCEIVRMMYGLRKAWATSALHEDPVVYKVENSNFAEPLFHHEKLKVYGMALNLMVWFMSLPESKELTHRFYRQIDEGITSIVLNIAEGNGRYSDLDHHRFLEIAKGSATKVTTYLDLTLLPSP
jgi:four helix bundle protein